MAKATSKALRTAKGNVTATARKKFGTTPDGGFPIFDEKSAKSALKLQSWATPAQRAKIKAKAARFVKKAGKK